MEQQQPVNNATTNEANYKVKLICSYGGKIQPRPTDHHLSYVGGDTKILTVDRTIKFSEFVAKLNSLCNVKKSNTDFCIKYQLPGEDLDSLVSLIDDEDVEHMMVEYDRIHRISAKPARLRLFLFNTTHPAPANSVTKDLGQVTPLNPDYLFGFDKEYQPSSGPPLDLLQIPGIVLPDNPGSDARARHVAVGELHAMNCASGNVAAGGQVIYRVPMTTGGVLYQPAQFAYGVAPGAGNLHREPPLQGYVPAIPSVQEQKVMVNPEVKVNQRD